MKKLIRYTTLSLLIFLGQLETSAQERMPSLSTVPLSGIQGTANTWSPDRLVPNSFANIGTFQSRSNVLQIGILGSSSNGNPGAGSGDSPTPTGGGAGFQALQGRTYFYGSVINGAWTLSADLWIESSWSNPANGLRRAELWGTSSNVNNNTAGLPAIGFTNEGNNGATGVGRFRWATGNWNETWFNVPAATAPVNYGAWNSFKIEFVPTDNLFKYYVNGILVASFTSIVPVPGFCSTCGGTSTGFNSVILQTYNYTGNSGVGYNVHWSNTPPPPTLTTTGTLSAFSTCPGIASIAQSFTVSGANLTANLVVTAPTGYEVSTSSGSGYGSTVTLTPSSGSVASTLIYVRLTSSASNGASGNVSVTSTGAAQQNVATGTATVGSGSCPPPSVSVTLLQDGGCQFPYITSSGFFSMWLANSNSNWQSTDGSVEVWESGAHGYTGYEGTRFTEVNVFGPATLSQQFSSPGAGVITTVKFAHRGRPPYTNTMRVSIGPVGGSYTTLGDYTTGLDAWVLYSANYTFPSTGNYEIRFEVLSPLGDGRGNFLDAVSISTSAINTTVSGGTSTTAFITPFSTCAGTPSSAQSFPVSGKNLTANLVVTAPTGYEVSLSSGSGYASSVSIAPTSGTVDATTIWVRLSSSATNGASGNVTVTSTGAVTQNVATGTGTVDNCTFYYGGSGDGHAMSTSPLAAAPLPVTWLDFTGEQVKERVKLNWQTANEQNSSHFEIERSANGGEYTRIGRLNAAGNSVNIRSYEFWDETPPTGVLLYRLRQVDIDGRFSYSKVVLIRSTVKSQAKIGPNPTGGAVTLQIPADWGSDVEWRLYNTQGQLLEQRTKLVSGNYTIDLTSRTAGTYQLTLWKKGELAQKEWIIRR